MGPQATAAGTAADQTRQQGGSREGGDQAHAPREPPGDGEAACAQDGALSARGLRKAAAVPPRRSGLHCRLMSKPVPPQAA